MKEDYHSPLGRLTRAPGEPYTPTTTIIDMAQVTAEHLVESPAAMSPTSFHQADAPVEQPTKLKGRKRLLQGLQRISSSPSLALMGRSTSSAYHGGGRGSISCVSLALPTPSYGHSSSSSNSSQIPTHLSPGFSTASTSVAGTPSPEMGCLVFMSRVRVVEKGGLNTPASVSLPSEVRFSSMGATLAGTPTTSEDLNDYFSIPADQPQKTPRKEKFDFWTKLPDEIKVGILQLLEPKEIVRCSAVSKKWHRMCFDGQLWTNIDASKFYRDIPAKSLVKLLTSAGPFIKDLNLRGCVQMKERWGKDSREITQACKNLEYFSIERCPIDKTSIHYFLLQNSSLVHINLSGLNMLNNSAMKIIAQNCSRLEYLNVSWCTHVDTKGLQKVVRACPNLKDLRAAEIKGFNDREFLLDLFERNALERLIISDCTEFDDDALLTMIQGNEPEIDVLTERVIVSPRAFRHLDFSRCRNLTNKSVKQLAYSVPLLVGLRLSQCSSLTDDALDAILESTPRITHLDLEELNLTNNTLTSLAKSPCAPHLKHLNVSYCEALGDVGMLAVLKSCPSLRMLEMDNTRVSDLSLTEAAAQVHERNRTVTTGNPNGKPKLGLKLVVYDCQNVTWTGVREVLSRNAEFFRRPNGSSAPTYPKEIVSLKCFYGYQPTVVEHTKRVLRGELARATLLERKWAEHMMTTEEVGAPGSGWRRRRRRAREAERAHNNEADEVGRGGRRRARSGGCLMM